MIRSQLMIVATWISVLTLRGDPGRADPQAGARRARGPAARLVATRGSDWSLTVAPDATVVIQHRGAPVVTIRYMFFGAKWSWAGLQLRLESQSGGRAVLAGESPGMKVKVSGAVSPVAANAIAIDYQLQAAQSFTGVNGGGIQWNLKLDAPSFGGRLPDPILLDGSTGWAWAVAGRQSLTVRADHPLPEVYFEQHRKDTIRTFFYGSELAAGTHRVRLTIALPEGGRRQPSAGERYGELNTRTWYRDALAWDAAPVDLRFLSRTERPAGRHGVIRADGDRLVFQDGTPARFWGANLAGYALFRTPRPNIARQARRMAQLGYNLMRIHHHDSRWVQPNVFEPHADDTRHLDPASLDTLDWWIKCLEDEGIYIWLDLNVGRVLRPGDPVSLGRDEIMREGGQIHGFEYYNEDLQKLMIEFQHAYLNHLNRYTHRAYKDDPAVIGVLITNEDDFTHHHGGLMLPDKNHPAHNALFTRDYKAFARRHGLPEARVFQTWLPGPSKLFVNEVEHRFNRTMVADLRGLGVQAPIATTNFWGNDWLTSLPALTDGGVIDVHSYGTSEAFDTNPRYEENYVHWIGAGQVAGKPTTVTEWNVEYPAADRFTAPLYVASIAALQGWDAPMLYNYSQVGLVPPRDVDKWSTFLDPALCGVMPAAALAFRQGQISPARTTYCLMLDAAGFFNRKLTPSTSATIRTLVEQSRLTIGIPAVKELPWLKPSLPRDATVLHDPDRDFIPQGQSFVRSDTGEITRDWELGIQTIDAPRIQAVSGWIGGRTLKTRDAAFQFRTKKAVVALNSVDNQPLSRSRFILITAMARALASPGDRPPMLSEPVVGTLTLRTTTDRLQLLALGRDGRVVGRTTPPRADGVLTVSIPHGGGTHWFVLQAGNPPSGSQPAKGQRGG